MPFALSIQGFQTTASGKLVFWIEITLPPFLSTICTDAHTLPPLQLRFCLEYTILLLADEHNADLLHPRAAWNVQQHLIRAGPMKWPCMHQLLQGWRYCKDSIAKLQVSLHSNSLERVMHGMPAGFCFGHALVHTPAEETLIHPFWATKHVAVQCNALQQRRSSAWDKEQRLSPSGGLELWHRCGQSLHWQRWPVTHLCPPAGSACCLGT